MIITEAKVKTQDADLAHVGLGFAAVAETPLTAALESAPDAQDGSEVFTVRLAFSEALLDSFSFATLAGPAVDTSRRTITRARRVVRQRADRWRWDIDIKPSGDGDVTLTLKTGPSAARSTRSARATRDGSPKRSRSPCRALKRRRRRHRSPCASTRSLPSTTGRRSTYGSHSPSRWFGERCGAVAQSGNALPSLKVVLATTISDNLYRSALQC